MKEVYKFSLENIDIDDVVSNTDILLSQIKNIIKSELDIYLLDHLPNKDGSPSINDLNISHFSYEKKTNQGSFRLHFNIDRIYCCSDSAASNSDYVDFNFTMDDNNIIARTEYFVWEINN